MPNADARGKRTRGGHGRHRHGVHGSRDAAELMLDHPNHFICHSAALLSSSAFAGRGRCVATHAALSADEDLEFGHVYFLLPMRCLSSTLSAAEVAALTNAGAVSVRRSVSRKHAAARIQPVGATDGKVFATAATALGPLRMPKLQDDCGEDSLPLAVPWRLKLKLSSGKLWNRVLEPITESPRVVPPASAPCCRGRYKQLRRLP